MFPPRRARLFWYYEALFDIVSQCLDTLSSESLPVPLSSLVFRACRVMPPKDGTSHHDVSKHTVALARTTHAFVGEDTVRISLRNTFKPRTLTKTVFHTFWNTRLHNSYLKEPRV